MFTVVIAEKEHIDSIQKYSLFLGPLLKKSDVAFMAWDTEAASMDDMVLMQSDAEKTVRLSDVVAEHQEWRAIVVADKKCQEKTNPFNRVEYREPVLSDSKNIEDNEHLKLDEHELFESLNRLTVVLKERLEGKKKAYDLACKEPFVRLVTYLCELPHVSGEIDEVVLKEDSSNYYDYQDYLILKEYQEEALYKEFKRKEILSSDNSFKFTYPTEVICLALRTHTIEETDIKSAWSQHTNYDYSRFYDWNMYFDRMRFLTFDILPKEHTNYISDYIRFLSVLLLLSANSIPSDSFASNKLYVIDCETDKKQIGQELGAYYQKLCATRNKIDALIDEVIHKESPELKDKDVDAIFCTNVSVPVSFGKDVDRDALYPQKLSHLATDIPTTEAVLWNGSYTAIRNTLHTMFKQAPRVVHGAIKNMRQKTSVETEDCRYLNDFQSADVWDHIHDEELKMVSSAPVDFCNASEFRNRMEEAKKNVDKKLDTRITKKGALVFFGSSLIVLLLSFLPLLISNRGNFRTAPYAIGIVLFSIAMLLLICLISLLVFKHDMNKTENEFVDVVRDIEKEIYDGMNRTSNYLGHVCSSMRAYSVVNYGKEHISQDSILIGTYKKHQHDIDNQIQTLKESCGAFLPDDINKKKNKELPYDYNFELQEEYLYDIPYVENIQHSVSFIQEGNMIFLPVDFIKDITTRMEEQYE